MSKAKEEFKAAADHVGVLGTDRLALWGWWLKAWKCATAIDEEAEAKKFMALYPIPEICEWDATNKKFIRYTTSDRLEAEWGDHYLNHFDTWLSCAKSRAEP